MHLQALVSLFLLATFAFPVRAIKYCDEFASKCHPCTSEVRCFCRHNNKEVHLPCLNLAGSGRNYLQLLNYEGELICPTDYTYTKMMKKRNEIDETYMYKHMCHCTDMNDVAKDCNSKNVLHAKIAEIARPAPEKEGKSDSIHFPCSEMTTEPSDPVQTSSQTNNCIYPMTWFLGSHCDRAEISALVWALSAIVIGQAFVILSMLFFIVLGYREREPKIVALKQADNQGLELSCISKAINDNNCGKDVENIYSEPITTNENTNGYLPMRSPLTCQYEEPIHFKPCYINNKLMDNSTDFSKPI